MRAEPKAAVRAEPKVAVRAKPQAAAGAGLQVQRHCLLVLLRPTCERNHYALSVGGTRGQLIRFSHTNNIDFYSITMPQPGFQRPNRIQRYTSSEIQTPDLLKISNLETYTDYLLGIKNGLAKVGITTLDLLSKSLCRECHGSL